jgi:hypothetical protein
MNTYFYHMLQRAREVHKENNELTGRDSPLKCPFCKADEQEQWFRMCHKVDVKFDAGAVPEKPYPPHCQYCPLQSLIPMMSIQDLMDDCVAVGKFVLAMYEMEGSDHDEVG